MTFGAGREPSATWRLRVRAGDEVFVTVTGQGAAAGFVRKFFGMPVTNFISPMDAIAPNSDPKGLSYWTTSPTVRGAGLLSKRANLSATLKPGVNK